MKNGNSEIAVNGLFCNLKIPEYMIDVTIAHELVHYLHGFNSPYEKMYVHPHKGGVVEREMRKRGFGHLIRLEKEFSKRVWPGVYASLTFKEIKKKGFISRIFS